MKRFIALKYFIPTLRDSDIAIFTGHEMCKEAYRYDRPGNLYLEYHYGLAPAFALGLAMCTDKRVFVFIGEGELLREMAVAVQMAASKCKNIILMVLDNGIYQSVGAYPNISQSIKSKRGTMFHIGVLVYDFTVYFAKKEFDNMKSFMKNINGPLAIFIDVDPGLKKGLPPIEISFEDQKSRLMDFVQQKIEVEEPLIVTGPVLDANDVKPGGSIV